MSIQYFNQLVSELAGTVPCF